MLKSDLKKPTVFSRGRSHLDWLHRAVAQGYPWVGFGTGVCEPSFWATQRPEIDFGSLIAAWRDVLPSAVYLSVRGPRSAQLLAAQGLPRPAVIGDPALSICRLRSLARGRSYRLGINCGSHGFIWGEQTQINQTIARLAADFLDRGWQVEFVAMHPSDRRMGAEIRQKFGLEKLKIWSAWTNLAATLWRLQTYDLMIGQRLHAVVLASGSGVPAISLAYQPKCFDFMESMNQLEFSIRTDELSLELLLNLSNQIDRNYRQHCEQLNWQCQFYQTEQKQAA